MKIFRPLRTPLAIALFAALAGCAVGPTYERPQVAVPAHYTELPGWMRAAPASDAPKGAWWTVFDDPLLNDLAPQVATSNQTVALRYANYQAALASIRIARSALFPTLGVSANASRQRTAGGSGGASSGSGAITNSSALQASVSWAPDLWGSVRRNIEENRANAQASKATLANATLAEQVALANAVISLRVTDANIALLRDTVQAYTDSLQIVENQGRAGTTPPSNVITARVQLKNAQANLIALGVARAQYVHAIAVLVGRNPEALDVAERSALPALPTIPAGVPSALLQRRPDIAIAERQMAAQNAAIGVAEAAYYPNVSLSAAVGLAQSPMASLLHLATHVWSLGADVGELVFDGGARSGSVAVAQANYNAAVANYRGTVLAAFQSVEDNLASLRILEQQAVVLDDAVRDAQHATAIARNEFAAGTVDFTTVVVAQTTQLADQQTALGVHAQRLLSTAALIGNLGGGWSDEALNLASAAPIAPVAPVPPAATATPVSDNASTR